MARALKSLSESCDRLQPAVLRPGEMEAGDNARDSSEGTSISLLSDVHRLDRTAHIMYILLINYITAAYIFARIIHWS